MKSTHLSGLALSSLVFVLSACSASDAQEPQESKQQSEKPVEKKSPSTFDKVQAQLGSRKGPTEVDEKILERERYQKEAQRVQRLRAIHSKPESALKTAVQKLYRYNSSGVVTEADFDLAERKNEAQRRARVISQYLTHDLNGDLVLTRSEVEESMRENQRGNRATFELAFMNEDSDGDGKLSIEEILAVAEGQKKTNNRGLSDREYLKMFDLNSDGSINPQEVSDAIDAILAQPVPEQPNYRNYQAKAKATCSLPAPSEDAEIIIVTGLKGGGLSNVAANGSDKETGVAQLEIETGTSPLYIFATASGSTIWQLTGETQRVERFVAQPRSNKKGPGVGVVGLSESKVAFVEPGSCGTYAKSPTEGKARLLKGAVATAAKRDVKKLIAQKSLTKIGVPSGTALIQGEVTTNGPMISTPSGDFYIVNGKPVAADDKAVTFASVVFTSNYPAGMVSIDAKQVVSPGEVKRYEVLPGHAGLTQLLDSGHLSRTPDGYYMIEKTFPHFPAGLAGAHSAKFILKKGVELPSGSVGHSSVVSEETGECLSGMRCR